MLKKVFAIHQLISSNTICSYKCYYDAILYLVIIYNFVSLHLENMHEEVSTEFYNVVINMKVNITYLDTGTIYRRNSRKI